MFVKALSIAALFIGLTAAWASLRLAAFLVLGGDAFDSLTFYSMDAVVSFGPLSLDLVADSMIAKYICIGTAAFSIAAITFGVTAIAKLTARWVDAMTVEIAGELRQPEAKPAG